jgi:hypothetical protein
MQNLHSWLVDKIQNAHKRIYPLPIPDQDYDLEKEKEAKKGS